MLQPEMSMTEELKEYLLYILNIPEIKVDEIIKTYKDNYVE